MQMDPMKISQKAETDVGLNTILYGPPGTGKTYHTTIYAVAIIENKPLSMVESEEYEAVLERYHTYKAQGRIAFTTFHQSYGYEEFMEGIKPILPDLNSEGQSGNISYGVQSGVFKQFCEKAECPAAISTKEYGIGESPSVWKVSLDGTGDNPTRTECLKNDHIRIGWDDYGKDITDETDFSASGGRTVLNAFINKMRVGDIVLSCYSASAIDAIGVVTGEYEWHDEYPRLKRLRNVNWIVKDIRENILEINGGTSMTLSSVYRLNISLTDIYQMIEKYQQKMVTSDAHGEKPNGMHRQVWAIRNRAGDKDVLFDYEDYLYTHGVAVVEDIHDHKRQCNYLANMMPGDWVMLGRDSHISAIGIVMESDVSTIDVTPFHWQKRVKWLARNLTATFADLSKPNKIVSNFAVAKITITISELQRLLPQAERPENYVFIIDEINRGNISKVFGELITLIEPSKRIGGGEEMTVRLPYSQKLFGVPQNVYILGTMNTADRSIAVIDTALRRRFQFREMLPDTKVLDGITVEGMNIGEMLDKINQRITALYDREHTIGHAYFLPLKEEPTIQKLGEIFQNNIVPLLQEYFYEDYEKIRLVLGDNQKSESDRETQFVVQQKVTPADLFGDTKIELDLGNSFEINSAAFYNLESYQFL